MATAELDCELAFVAMAAVELFMAPATLSCGLAFAAVATGKLFVADRDTGFFVNSDSVESAAGASVNSGSPENEQELPKSRHRAASNSGQASLLAAVPPGGAGFGTTRGPEFG